MPLQVRALPPELSPAANLADRDTPVDGKVRHEHVAALGAGPIEPSMPTAIAFWAALHQRLGKLSNRFSHDTQGKLIGVIHARIPMPTADEQRQLQKERRSR